MPVEEAARALFALARAPAGLARSLLEDVVARRRAARLARGVRRARRAARARPAARGRPLRRRRPGDDGPPARPARRSARSAPSGSRRCCPPGRSRRSSTPACPSRPSSPGSPGIADRDLRGAPRPGVAVRRFLAFAGEGAVIVAHNARFDLAFLDREVELLTGRRLAAPVVDTVGLARRLLAGRVAAGRPRLARALLRHVGASRATARSPTRRRPRRSSSRCSGSPRSAARGRSPTSSSSRAPRRRRVYEKRSLVFGAPTRPGVYLFRDANGQVLYVGRARDLRARLRSYFRSERQRPAVEAALARGRARRVAVLGSELEAALEELRLIRELRPPANARGKRGGRGVLPARRGERRRRLRAAGTARPDPEPPPRRAGGAGARRRDRGRSSRRCSPAARSRACARGSRDLSDCLRYEDAARLRDRIAALEHVIRELAAARAAPRRWRLCLLVPAAEPGFTRAVFVARGRVVDARACCRRAPGRRSRCGPASRRRGGRAVARARGRRGAPAPRLLPPPAAAGAPRRRRWTRRGDPRSAGRSHADRDRHVGLSSLQMAQEVEAGGACPTSLR